MSLVICHTVQICLNLMQWLLLNLMHYLLSTICIPHIFSSLIIILINLLHFFYVAHKLVLHIIRWVILQSFFLFNCIKFHAEILEKLQINIEFYIDIYIYICPCNIWQPLSHFFLNLIIQNCKLKVKYPLNVVWGCFKCSYVCF